MVLLLTVSSFLYVSRISYTDKLHDQARESVNEFIETNSINQYVTSCLYQVGAEGLKILARQGGVIYDYQGGLTPTKNVYFIEGVNYYSVHGVDGEVNVSYAIVPISQNYCDNYYPQNLLTPNLIVEDKHWQYPVEKLQLSDFEKTFSSSVSRGCFDVNKWSKDLSKSGYLGYWRFPSLCSNNFDSYFESYFVSNVCATEKYKGSKPGVLDVEKEHSSVASQLESFVKNNMVNCFDESIYEEQGDEITVDLEQANITVFFMNTKGILINSKFPFEISLKGKKPIVELIDFQQTIDINFLDTYFYLFDLISEMVSNPFFNFENDYTSLDSFKSSFEIKFMKGDCENCNSPYSAAFSDTLSITDTSTGLLGQPLTFFVSFTQRKPVLNYISNPDQTFKFSVDNEEVYVDYLFYMGETMELEITGMDPNYDNYEIIFSGWKETTDEFLDVEACRSDHECNIFNYEDYTLNTENNELVDLECCRTIGCTLNEIHPNCLLSEPYVPNILSSHLSETGLLTYNLKETDLGYHEFTVQIKDEHGAIDYQTVRILVYDSPLAVLEPKNMYDDVNPLFASIEDNYTLSATESQASVFSEDEALSFYVYSIPYEKLSSDDESYFEFKTDKSNLNLPIGDFTFKNILEGIFKKDIFINLVGEKNKLENVELLLRVEQVVEEDTFESPTTISEITISECLPHGFEYKGTSGFYETAPLIYYNISSYEEDGLPYYSKYSDDDISDYDKFQLPHVCCVPTPIKPLEEGELLSSGKFAESNSVCYQNKAFQTCYPPRDRTAQELKTYLHNPVLDSNGFIEEFSEDLYTELYGGLSNLLPPGLNAYGLSNKLGNAINDIFLLTYQQSCSGNRGNVCSGEIKLDWDLSETIECDDLSIPGQFARCEGPGLPVKANEIEGWANPSLRRVSSYFGKPFSSKINDYSWRNPSYSCQSGDANKTFNVSLVCNDYSSGSFEKDFLEISTSKTQGLTTEIAAHIYAGYCAGPEKSKIKLIDGEIEISTPNFAKKVFDCFATCKIGETPEETGCIYGGVNTCECNANGAPECDGAQADDLFKYDDGFVCYKTNVCDQNCEEPSGAFLDKKQCYCTLQTTSESSNTVNPVLRQNSLSKFQSSKGYFGDAPDDKWLVSDTDACCTLNSGLFAVRKSSSFGSSSDYVCFDGNLKSSGSIFSLSDSEINNLLSFEGKVYYCSANDDLCVDETMVLTNPMDDNQCLTLTNDGGCEYRFDEDEYSNASCCNLNGLNKCSEDELCKLDECCDEEGGCDDFSYCNLFDCCIGDHCKDNNVNCDSVDHSNCLTKLYSSDNTIKKIVENSEIPEKYIAEAVNVGKSFPYHYGRYKTCTTNGWKTTH